VEKKLDSLTTTEDGNGCFPVKERHRECDRWQVAMGVDGTTQYENKSEGIPDDGSRWRCTV